MNARTVNPLTDNVSPEVRQKTMRAVKSSNTSFENRVHKELWRCGIRFRKNVQTLMGKPDIAIKKYKVVIFLDSCFWHGCPEHCRMPSSNIDYWRRKIQRNRLRDGEVFEYYIHKDWNVLRIWEHEVKQDFDGAIGRIISFIQTARCRQT